MQPTATTTTTQRERSESQLYAESGSSNVPDMQGRLPCPENEDHASVWTNIQLSRPTLATFTKRIAFRGFAQKRGPSSRNLWNWSRVFLLLQYPFLAYFKSNDPSTRCLGVVYLAPPCEVRRLAFYPSIKNVVQIKPLIRRNLRHKTVHEDEDNYYFSFETEEEAKEWEEVILREIARGYSEEEEEREGNIVGGDSDDDDRRVALGAVSLHNMNLKEAAQALRTLDTARQPIGESVGGTTSLDADKRQEVAHEGDSGGNDSDRASSSASSARSSRKSASQRSSILPRFKNVDTRRRSFFATDDMMECLNVDTVHRTHCCRCKVSPVIGFLYTCVVCDGVELCGSCFRREDHDIRHLFLVSPDVEGESIRVLPSGEGGCFRIAELIVFEALFRVVGDDMDGYPTSSMSKSRLCRFWNTIVSQNCAVLMGSANGAGGAEVAGVRHITSKTSSAAANGGGVWFIPKELELTEKDLTLVCRDPERVTFKEFMFIVRCKLASRSAAFFMDAFCQQQLPAHQRSPLHLEDYYGHDNNKKSMVCSSAGEGVSTSSFSVHEDKYYSLVEGSFALIAQAFSVLSRALRSYREPSSSSPSGPALSSAGQQQPQLVLPLRLGDTSSSAAAASPLSELERACLQMLLGACSIVPLDATEEQIPVQLYSQIVKGMYLACGFEDSSDDVVINAAVAEDFPKNGGWLVEEDEELFPVSLVVQKVATRWMFIQDAWRERILMKKSDGGDDTHNNSEEVEQLSTTAQLFSPLDHRFVEVVEHVLCYEVGGALGLYSDQLESIHSEVCSSCQVVPIIGFCFEEVAVVEQASGGAHSDDDRSVKDSSSPSAQEEVDSPHHFCQSCVTSKRWITVYNSKSQVPSGGGATGRSSSNSSGRRASNGSQSTAAASTAPTATESADVKQVKLRRLPSGVVALYDVSTGKVTTSSGPPASHSSRR